MWATFPGKLAGVAPRAKLCAEIVARIGLVGLCDQECQMLSGRRIDDATWGAGQANTRITAPAMEDSPSLAVNEGLHIAERFHCGSRAATASSHALQRSASSG